MTIYIFMDHNEEVMDFEVAWPIYIQKLLDSARERTTLYSRGKWRQDTET